MNTPKKTDDDFKPIDSQVRIGHVHLKVAEIERSLAFYCGVLGFELTQRFGASAAFISAGGDPHPHRAHHLERPGGSPPPPRPHRAAPPAPPPSDRPPR